MISLGFCVVAEFKWNTMDPIDIQSPRLFRMIHWRCAVVMVIQWVLLRCCVQKLREVIAVGQHVINEINLVMKTVDSWPLTWSKNDWRGNNSLSSTCNKLIHLIKRREHFTQNPDSVYVFKALSPISENWWKPILRWNANSLFYLNPFISRMNLRLSICLELMCRSSSF